MKKGLKKGLAIAVALLIMGGIAVGWYLYRLPQHQHRATPRVIVPEPAMQDNTSAEYGTSVLNLALPQAPMLVDPAIALPGSPHDLRNLFTKGQGEPAVKVGGRLILEEKPPEPNAAVWDQVKGAEVGITIKTP